MDAKTRTPRIDSLKLDTKVTLRFHNGSGYTDRHNTQGAYDEQVVFLGIEGQGDERTARFTEPNFPENTDKSWTWEAYRHNGGWAYGSSAERLQLIAVHG